MITNKQKIIFCIFGFVSTLIAVFAILPFEILFDRLGITSENIQGFELISKLIVLPLLVLGITLYSMKVRNDNYYEQLDVSIVSIKMSYIPFAMYISGLMAWLGGVIYATFPLAYINSKEALICMIALWSGSVIIIAMFGAFMKWLYKMNAHQIVASNIIFIIMSMILIVFSFLIYKNIPEIQPIKENNAFLKMLIYVCLYFIVLLLLWKDLFSNKNTPVILCKDEKFTEEEEQELIVRTIKKDIKDEFYEFYQKNKFTYLDEESSKLEENIEENQDGQLVDEEVNNNEE